MSRTTISCAALVAGAVAFSGAALAQGPNRALQEIPADKAKVTGAITITYNSRSERSSSGLDVYEVQNLVIGDLMAYNGTVQRTPNKQLNYSLKIDVFNPSNPSQVAKDVAIIRGDLMIDERGRYNPEAGKLRLDVVKGQQFTSPYKGVIQGREVTRWWEIAERLKKAQGEATKLYTRYVDGKNVTIQVKNPDPLTFEGLGLPTGPYSYLVESRVGGTLDYDYELGNWLTDAKGVTFGYTIADKAYTDKLTGSVRYVEEEGSFTDPAGKKRSYTGYYDYTLRMNEAEITGDPFFKPADAQGEADAFFSSADQSKPGIYGRVYYYDTEDYCKKVKGDDGKFACVGPTKSEVYYDLKPVGLTYQQLANWMKLEPLIIGPFTDE
jgi:hypothetical protein